jgi:hypothetical protein
MPVIEPAIIARGMAEMSTQVHQLHQLMPRSVDHRALETLAVGKSYHIPGSRLCHHKQQ